MGLVDLFYSFDDSSSALLLNSTRVKAPTYSNLHHNLCYIDMRCLLLGA